MQWLSVVATLPPRLGACSVLLVAAVASACASGTPAAEDAGVALLDARPPPALRGDGTWLASVTLPAPLDPLPGHAFVDDPPFETHDACGRCHTAEAGSRANLDEAGRDVGAVTLWRPSMMALSARDPYWLAVFGHELEANPRAATLVSSTCTRCHAPAAHEARGPADPIGLDAIARSTDDDATLARDGVTCTLCHQMSAEGLGAEASFTGGFAIDDGMRIYGPHASPNARNMTTATGYTATEGAHVMRSAACATCHTVITRALDERGEPTGPPFPEQVPYLEWRNSAYQDEEDPGPEAASCQDCHVPPRSADGEPLSVILSPRPATLEPRSPFGRHTFAGANAYMLDLLADHAAWLGAAATPEGLRAASDESEATLRSAVTLSLEVHVVEGTLVGLVHLENHAGHRFPTSYPTRRAFVRFTIEGADGGVLFLSGRTDEAGGLVDADGARLDYPGSLSPHYQVVQAQDQVQVYEAVMGDADGRVTHALLRATRYLKDDRLLPRGWSETHPDAARTAPVGTDDDPDFAPGRDTVRYQVPLPAGAARVRAELVYQSLPPAAVEHLFEHPTAAAARLDAMRRARPDEGRVVASDDAPLP